MADVIRVHPYEHGDWIWRCGGELDHNLRAVN